MSILRIGSAKCNFNILNNPFFTTVFGKYHMHKLLGEDLILSPHKAIFWRRKKMLLLGDLHLDKTSYFRKMGIQVPSEAREKNWSRLRTLLIQFKPNRVVFLGDLFHSSRTNDVDRLKREIQKNPGISFELVKGNHDILRADLYQELQLKIHDPCLQEFPFLFTHEEIHRESYYTISAHIHPAVKFKGNARQSLSVECFYFGIKSAIIPAFGSFTGNSTIRPSKNDNIFIILNDKVIQAN